MREHSNASPKTFNFIPTLPTRERHPSLRQSPMWADAPLAPADLHWAMVFGADENPIIREDGQPLESWYWRVVRCPYCSGQHWHSGFDPLAPYSVIGDKRNDPLQFIGGRKLHCDRNDQVWWAWPEYQLVPIRWRANRRINVEAERADLDRFFPRLTDGTQVQTPHGGVPVQIFQVERGLIHVKEIERVKTPRSIPQGNRVIVRAPITRELRSAVWHKTNGVCWYCGCTLDPFLNFNVDHVHPVVRGGTNDFANLVPACRRCNGAKHAKTIEEFRADRNGQRFWFELEGRER